VPCSCPAYRSPPALALVWCPINSYAFCLASSIFLSMRKKHVVSLTDDNRETLDAWARGRRVSVRLALRARIVLAAARGLHDVEIAQELDVSRHTAKLWRFRFLEGGTSALVKDAPRPGRKPSLDARKERSIVEATLHSTPTNATHWSVRTMARAQGVSRMTVQRVWSRHNLKPHRIESFKLSNDPAFVDKLHDIVGLYLDPPDRALVLCVDEKSQIQALERTRPMLPLAPGVPAKQTHDYKRHGTTTLFAALSVLDGSIIGQCMARHRHQEFIKFLNTINRQTPPELDLHLIVDNYATHKHPKVKAWCKRHKRFHFHFTPTSSSWLNLVERWFGALSAKRIKRGSFTNVSQLIKAIHDHIGQTNTQPTRFIWTATAERIMNKIAKIKKCIEPLGTPH